MLDLYFRADQNVEFLATGGNDIHLTGYFEPTDEDSEGEGLEGEEEEGSESFEVEKPKQKVVES